MEMAFVLELLLSLAALCLLYFVLLNLRKNGMRQLFIRTAAAGALILSSMSLAAGYAWFFDEPSPALIAAAASLAAGLFSLIILVFSFNRALGLDARLLANIAFGALLAHIFFAAIAAAAAYGA